MDLKKGDRVLIVNDMFTTGKGIEELLTLTKKYDTSIKGVVLFSRSSYDEKKCHLEGIVSQGLVYSMTNFIARTYERGDSCPLCRNSQDDIVYSKDLN